MTLPALPDEIFRAYDIRGIVGEGLTPDLMYWLGKAIGSEALYKKETTLLLAYDARLSSPEFAAQMKNGILETGCHVIDLGQVPTPLLYFATHTLACHSGVMITGSHNPKEYNGVKVVFKQQSLSDAQITIFKDRIFSQELSQGQGKSRAYDIKPDYIRCISADINLKQAWKVVIDCGNAITANVAPELFTRLGCEVTPLFCELDGSFPNHHPDPTQAENLSALRQRVLDDGADLGIAFDGDGDRVALLSSSGEIFDADHLLMAFVRDILPQHPGATVVYDVKSTHHLVNEISVLGGQPLMCKSGHSYVKKALQVSGALLGGEYSSHLFFKHRWFGFDDGMYAAARFLELMDKNACSADDILASLPSSAHTPELFVPVSEAEKFSLMKLIALTFRMDEAEINRLDGLRVTLPTGWGLIRASNTTPNLVLRFEADNANELEHLKHKFRQELKRIVPALAFNF
jgi:phosphomannomutase/phosphoglucomutase